MTSALKRGRTLSPGAVEEAKRWREQRITHLDAKMKDNPLSLTRKERHELSRLTGRSHPAGLVT